MMFSDIDESCSECAVKQARISELEKYINILQKLRERYERRVSADQKIIQDLSKENEELKKTQIK